MRRSRLCSILIAVLLASPGARAAIVVNEIMYNSLEADDVEYVELYNTGPGSVDLANWYLLDADPTHPRCFLSGSLAAGQYLVVAGFLDRFTAKYPGVTNLNPNQFDNTDPASGFSLGNGGDSARLFDPIGVLVDYVAYDDAAPWPTSANGGGPSLELLNPSLDNTLGSSWAASSNAPPHGTPGVENSTFTSDQPPVIDSVARNIPLPRNTDTVTVTARVTDDQALASVDLLVNKGAGFTPQAMFDDGTHGDGLAGDGTYGARIPPQSNNTLVRYYVSATDDAPQTSTSPPGAPAEYLAYTVGYTPPQLFVNEILASNLNGAVDEQAQPEDWVEIRNRSTSAVNLTGMYLSNDLDQGRMWQLPSTTLQPEDFLLIWCDNDESQGPTHSNFKLDKAFGRVGFFDTVDHGNVLIHGVKYGPQNTDVSFGFFPDDTDAMEYLAVPTPDASNNTSSRFGSICINEFQTTSLAGGADDWIELFNRGSLSVDVGGWHVSDDALNPTKYTIPAGTPIAPGGRHTVNETQLGFGFEANGSEEIVLTRPDGLTGEDYFDYGPQSPDVSQGRYPEGTGNWHFFDPPSLGTTNSCAGGAVLGAVQNVRFSSAKTTITWNTLAGAEDYDVVRGDLGLLRSSGGNFTTATNTCHENDGTDARTRAAGNPPSGKGFFYLVRGATFSCGFGTYDSGVSSQVGSRDAEIESAPSHCP